MENQDLQKLKNQEDVRPSEALENLVKNEDNEHLPKTTGTGANNAVPREGSLIIKKEDEDEDADS